MAVEIQKSLRRGAKPRPDETEHVAYYHMITCAKRLQAQA